jgi:hypothetical protein
MTQERTQASDTSRDVEQVRIESWRGMKSWEKARQLQELVRAVHALSLVGLRQRHPGSSEEEIRARAARLWLGEDLYSRALKLRRDGAA